MVPERIGKYVLRRKLGEGATAAVHLAWDEFAGREVALKLINADVLADAEKGRLYRHLLVNEASLAGKLLHPHIVQIYDAVVDEVRQSYIVMEYVAGGTLERYCSADALLPIERVVELVFKCTRALDYAFRMGITHRDIKPANILIASDGDIKVSDFGAAIQRGNPTQTQVTGIGSPAYMSPQQLRELPLDHRTDIWSLGVVMYRLLTGRQPFQASNDFALIYQICNVDPPPPSTFNRDVPQSIDAIVMRALQRDLDRRYASWEEFAHDLAQAFRNRQRCRQEPAESEKFESLRALDFFREFSDVEIWEVVRLARWDSLVPGTLIMKDGEPGDHFCFLIEGELAIVKRGRVLGLLGTGDVFGEMAVINRHGHVRGADVVVRTAARIVTIAGTALRSASAVCRMHFYQSFLEVLAARLAQANTRLATT